MNHIFLYLLEVNLGLMILFVAYKLFFEHVEPYMDFMANELRNKKPPANVMRWAKKYQIH